MNISKWIKENTSDLTNKTIAITGSTGGLLNYVVKVFASLGANFIFLNRNKEKTQKQINEIIKLYPNTKIDFIPCDLSNFDSVKSATEELKQKQFNTIYFASGVYNVPRFKTNLGYNNIFQTNFVSNYYIIKQLLTKIKSENINVVAVSSIAYNYSKIDTNDIDFSKKKKHSKVYGNSKRYLTFALHELAQKEKINLSIVHPGVTLTNMTNHYPKAVNWLVKIFIKFFFPSVEKASLSLIKGVFENTNYLEWIGPKILNVWGKPKKVKLRNINKTEINKIFKIAEEIYNNLTK